MKWIGPLFKSAGGWEAYVAFSDGAWYVDNESPVKIGEGKSGIMLLPILQEGYGQDYATQIELLKSGLAENGMDPEIAYSFPFVVPVLTAYRSMPNWANFAVKWLPDIKLEKESAVVIFDACHSTVLAQGVRQATIKYINKWSSENGFQFSRPKKC